MIRQFFLSKNVMAKEGSDKITRYGFGVSVSEGFRVNKLQVVGCSFGIVELVSDVWYLEL